MYEQNNNSLCVYCGNLAPDSETALNGQQAICVECADLVAAGLLEQTLQEETRDRGCHIIDNEGWTEESWNDYLDTPDGGATDHSASTQNQPDLEDDVPVL